MLGTLAEVTRSLRTLRLRTFDGQMLGKLAAIVAARSALARRQKLAAAFAAPGTGDVDGLCAPGDGVASNPKLDWFAGVEDAEATVMDVFL